MWKHDDGYRFNIFTDPKIDSIIRSIDSKNFQKLGDCFEFSLGITPYDSYKGHSKELIKQRKFHSSEKVDDTYVPLISGANVGHYRITDDVKEYLSYGDWLGAPRKRIFFTSPRVIVRQILSNDHYGIHAGYTEQELYHTQIGFSIIESKVSPFSTKVLCACLNSKLINFYHKFKFTDPEKDTFQKILIENTKSFPLPNISADLVIKISELVDRIGSVDKTSPEFASLQQEIDLIFYNLYGLTYDDMLIVDPSTSIPRNAYSQI